MSKEELEKNQKSPPPEPTLPETINQPEKIEPIKKEQIPDINTESEYTDHLGFDKKYWNNDEFQFHDFLKKQEKNESKLSIDAPNISKNRLHEYLNDDLINALDVSPKIPPQNINTPTSENEILLPNIENTNSSEYIQKRKKIKEIDACKIFQQIISGIEYLSKIRISHRDIKTENILINKNLKIKIIDFGLCNTYNKDEFLKTACGTM